MSGVPEMRLDCKTRLNFHVIPWHRYKKEGSVLSDFDVKLRAAWQASLEKGIFLHGVESEPHRIPGRNGYVGVLCRNRASHKRKSQSFNKIIQEMDPKLFNFTKVKDGEVLFKMQMPSTSHSKESPEKYCHFIINNSPYEFAHTLMVPELEKLQIQSITPDAIRFGIETLLSSSHPGFRVMYNSLCGGASINHLHLHCYYTEYWLNSEAYGMLPLRRTAASTNGHVDDPAHEKGLTDCFELNFEDTHIRGFGFVITEQNYETILPNIVYKMVQYFIGKNIAHNIVIIRGIPPSDTYIDENWKINAIEEKGAIDGQNPNAPRIEGDSAPYAFADRVIDASLKTQPLCGRVYLFPRKPILGVKSHSEFHVNVTELFGHLYFGNVEIFNSMSEEDIVSAFECTSLSEEEFAELKSDAIRVLL